MSNDASKTMEKSEGN